MSSSDRFVHFGYVEDSIRQRVVEWINKIIEDEKLPFDRADAQIEISLPDGSKRKFPDIIIWEKRLRKPVCLIELKQPSWGPTDWHVINDAQNKASTASPQVPYFATCNFNELVLWKTFEEGAMNWEERRKGIYHLARIKNLREIDYPEVENKFRDSLRRFLIELVEIYIEKKVLPTVPVDEFFIYSLRTVVDSLYFPITVEIKRLFGTNEKFRKELIEWFVSQGWNPPSTNEDFEKIARQFLYLLMNKVVFYNTLRKIKKIEPLQISETIKDGDRLKRELQKYFDIAKETTGDYETIFGFDFLEKIPIPDDVVPNLISFLNGFSRYDFTKLGYKDLGHIFDRLIPDDERHTLGQYYTNPDVVDIINTFCIRDADGKIADFGCGAGTFLVRAYARIKYLNSSKTHDEILKQIIGVDISKFAAHLSMINLASRELSKVENYPLVLCKDFFDITPSTVARWPEPSKESIGTLSGKKIKVELPPELDVVVGNPPYTRQEELETYVEDYKEKLQKALANDWGKDVKLGLRVGLHGYFFFHGLRFLKNGGRFGYITSNSWLDVDYGKYFQEFFLKHCKIIAIIEPKERVFPDADINTVITILERCGDKKEREENLVKFVQLKVPLKELIPESEDDKRFRNIEELVKLVESTNKLYEDDKLRIYPKSQLELWNEGYDEEEKQYVGSKWGKYLRAPEIFYIILEKGKHLFVPLKEIADVMGGIITGNNEFFYFDDIKIEMERIEDKFLSPIIKKGKHLLIPLKEIAEVRRGYIPWPYEFYVLKEEEIKKWGIEERYLNPVFRSPKESDQILLDDIRKFRNRILLVHEDKEKLRTTNVLKYINFGESKGYSGRILKEKWYDLGKRKTCDIIWVRTPYNKHCVYLNKIGLYVIDHVEIKPKENPEFYCALLNTTLYMLFREGGIYGRSTLGLGTLKTEVMDVKQLPVLDIDKLNPKFIQQIKGIFQYFSKRQIDTVFAEIGANSPEEVSLDKVKPDRRELDKIVMGEILGLSEKEQLEVYKAVIKLVKDRIERAKSVEKRKKVSSADPEALAEGILREINVSELKKFPNDYIGDYECETMEVPEGQPELGSDLGGFFVKVDDERISCSSLEEAQWVYYAILNGSTLVKIPKNKKIMKDILKEYTAAFKKINKDIDAKLENYIPDRKLREKVRTIIYKKLFKRSP